MSRPRAGHGWTSRQVGQRYIDFLMTADGEWITTGKAKGWVRCQRCRRPEQNPHTAPDGRTVCNTCYYYKFMTGEEFWTHQDDYLFPYNIGRRFMESLSATS